MSSHELQSALMLTVKFFKMYYTVVCRLRAGISESERTSVASQRVHNRPYHGNESLRSGVSGVTNPLAGYIEIKKTEGFQKCPLSSRQRILLRRWLTEIKPDSYSYRTVKRRDIEPADE
jgi:hypothetical protein